MEPGHNGNLSLMGNVYSAGDLEYRKSKLQVPILNETCVQRGGGGNRYIGRWWFPYRQVSCVIFINETFVDSKKL